MKKILFTILLHFTLTSMSAQITTTIKDVFLNSQTTVNNCSVLDFGTNQNNNLVIYFKLQRPQSLPNGSGTLRIYLKYNSNSISQVIGVPRNILDSYWANTNYESTMNCDISAFQIQVSGSSIGIEFETNGGVKTQSCEYPIIKTPPPSFSLSPSSISLACGDTSSRTFVVTPANIPSGAAVTYQWSYNGWTTGSSTSTSKTLQPTSGTSLPSGISVIPSINGVAYPILSCAVSRTAFSNSATINGNSVICPGNNSVYTLSGLGAGNTVTWNSSNNSIATVSGGTQSQVTVNGSSQGLVNLIATVTNACGQTAAPIIKPLNIGAPVMANGVIYGELWVRKNFFPQTLTFPAVLGATTYTWSVAASLDFPLICPIRGAISPKFSNDLQTITTTTPSAIATFGSCLGEYYVNCTVSNACGSSVAYTRFVTVGVSGTSPCDTNTSWSKAFTLSQNPIKNGEIKINKTSNLVIDNSPFEDDTSDPSIVDGDSPCYQEWPKIYNGKSNLNGNKSTNNSQIEVKIFDFYGKLVFSKIREIENEEISIKDTNLKPGQYIIHINNGSSSQKEIIIIE